MQVMCQHTYIYSWYKKQTDTAGLAGIVDINISPFIIVCACMPYLIIFTKSKITMIHELQEILNTNCGKEQTNSNFMLPHNIAINNFNCFQLLQLARGNNSLTRSIEL